MRKSLENQVAILTGATEGIGLEIAHMLAEENVKLMLNARTLSNLQKVKKELEERHGAETQVEIFPGNVADPLAVEDLVKTTLQRYGKIDILINNAGVCSKFALFQEFSLQEINDTLDINLKGPIYTMRAVIPQMVHQGGGTIVNINSIAGKVSYPYTSVYCASKYGLTALTESISMEQHQNNIKIIGIYPGNVNTPMWKKIEPHVVQNPDRMLDAKDVSEAVRYALYQPQKVLVKDLTVMPLNPPEH